MNIPFGKPQIDINEKKAVNEVLNGTQLVHGLKCKNFEQSFIDFLGSGYSTSLSSCTAGLHLALIALGIKKEDEVLVPAQSHVATVHSVEYVGAKPKFIDCELETGNINLELLEKKITKKTKALTVVHYLGMPVNLEKVVSFCKENSLFLIEDCALALGSRFKKKHVGLFGDIGSFSFYPVKHITTAEGGMVVSKKKNIIEKIKKLKAFGYDKTLEERKIPGQYNVNLLGYNFRMNELEAAIGIEQLKKLPNFIKKRRKNMNYFQKLLNDSDCLRILDNKNRSAYNSYYCLTIVLEGRYRKKRNKILIKLKEKGIGSSIYYPGPIPLFTYYKKKYGFKKKQFPCASVISDNSFSLPLGPHIKEKDIEYMVVNLKKILKTI